MSEPVPASTPQLKCRPLSRQRWPDLEELFGPRGAVGGCWCMWWRITRSEFDEKHGEGNRAAFRAVVERGEVPGLLAYAGRAPVGWCSIAPRSAFPVLGRSRVLRPVDDRPVWSIVCFFIAKEWRGRGVASMLLAEAVEYARGAGAEAVEGYPVAPRADKMPEAFAFTGVPAMFHAAGFEEIARRSPTRPIMRRVLS